MTTFKIGQTVYRQDPGAHEVSFQIKTEDDVKYHTDLQARGYKYTIVDGEVDHFATMEVKGLITPANIEASAAEVRQKLAEIDFNLPEVKDGLRIHRKPFEECESCSA